MKRIGGVYVDALHSLCCWRSYNRENPVIARNI